MGKPKSVDAPKVPDPIAEVVTGDQSADVEVKKRARAGGFKRNVLAGQLSPSTGKSSLLG